MPCQQETGNERRDTSTNKIESKNDNESKKERKIVSIIIVKNEETKQIRQYRFLENLLGGARQKSKEE